jgi:hypothetical protein
VPGRVLDEKSLAIVAKYRKIPCSLVDIHANEPAMQQVVFDALDKLPHRTNRQQALKKASEIQ